MHFSVRHPRKHRGNRPYATPGAGPAGGAHVSNSLMSAGICFYRVHPSARVLPRVRLQIPRPVGRSRFRAFLFEPERGDTFEGTAFDKPVRHKEILTMPSNIDFAELLAPRI